MQQSDFLYLSELIRQRSGLSLTVDKTYLLESRLQSVARTYDCFTIPDFVLFIQRNSLNQDLIRKIVEAMTTNESMFFRDQKPFDKLRQVIIPEIYNRNSKKVRIWSAACSNGQEPYSIAISLIEEQMLENCQVEIVATDIDTQVLEKAKQGIYTQFEVQRGLPIQLLLKYFDQIDNNRWQVRKSLRDMVNFRQYNLLDDMSSLGYFDLVFCRNVLIYFDEQTKKSVLEKLSKQLQPDGVLFLGSAETIIGLSDAFTNYDKERGIFKLNQPNNT